MPWLTTGSTVRHRISFCQKKEVVLWQRARWTRRITIRRRRMSSSCKTLSQRWTSYLIKSPLSRVEATSFNHCRRLIWSDRDQERSKVLVRHLTTSMLRMQYPRMRTIQMTVINGKPKRACLSSSQTCRPLSRLEAIKWARNHRLL